MRPVQNPPNPFLSHDKILNRIRQFRGGHLYNSQFGKRFSGEGVYWKNIEKMFYVYCDKFGLNQPYEKTPRLAFARPGAQRIFSFT